MRVLSEKELAQRRANVAKMAALRRAKKVCKRGHNNWRVTKSGKRFCHTCDRDRWWYAYRGFKYI